MKVTGSIKSAKIYRDAELAIRFILPAEKKEGGLTEAANIVGGCFQVDERSDTNTVVGVGWHTNSAKLLLQLGSREKMVIWSHGLGSLVFYSSKPFLSLLRIVARLFELIECARILRRCDCLVVAYRRRSIFDSRSIDEVMAHMYRTRVVVIPNAIDTSVWSEEDLGITRGALIRTYMVSIGRGEWQKGHESAMDIVARMRSNTGLNVIAPQMTSYLNRMKEKAANGLMKGRLKLSIGLRIEERRRLIRDACCMICWSETEYQSLSILEALACGCPVITRPRGWLRRRKIPGIIIVSCKQEAAEWAEKFYSDQQLRHELGECGKEYVKSRHDIRVVERMWARLSNELSVDG